MKAEDMDLSKIDRKWLSSWRKLTRLHGLGESAIGGLLLYQCLPSIEYFVGTGNYEDLPKGLIAFGGYLLLEGIIDIIIGQRKHHLTSNILEKFHIHKFSVPKYSDLEKRLYEKEAAAEH